MELAKHAELTKEIGIPVYFFILNLHDKDAKTRTLTAYTPLSSTADKGIYLFLDCHTFDNWNVNIFIHTIINQDVPILRRSDKVTISNGIN